MLHVSALDGSISAGYGADSRHARREGDRPGLSDRAEHKDFWCRSCRHVKEIIRLKINILFQITLLKKPFEVDRQQLALANEETTAQVRQFLADTGRFLVSIIRQGHGTACH